MDMTPVAIATPEDRWKTKANCCSPHYTTRLTDVVTLQQLMISGVGVSLTFGYFALRVSW
jgi:hypothetical protein